MLSVSVYHCTGMHTFILSQLLLNFCPKAKGRNILATCGEKKLSRGSWSCGGGEERGSEEEGGGRREEGGGRREEGGWGRRAGGRRRGERGKKAFTTEAATNNPVPPPHSMNPSAAPQPRGPRDSQPELLSGGTSPTTSNQTNNFATTNALLGLFHIKGCFFD